MSGRPPARLGASGFTLIEMLVALTLLAAVMAAVAGAIGQIGDGFRAGTDRARQLEDFALVRDVLRRQAARAFPVADGAPGREIMVFSGSRERLSFVLVEPAAPGRGGFALASFTVEAGGGGGSRLVYRQAPLAGGPEKLSVLAEGPYRFAFSYGKPGGGFVSDWSPGPHLPALVRLEMADALGPKPAVVVRFRVDAERGCVLQLGESFCRDRVARAP